MTNPAEDVTLLVLKLLAESKFEEIELLTQGVRLRGTDMKEAIERYGRKIVGPPPEVFSYASVIEIKSETSPQWSVVVPLWTSEEGRSDLTLDLTVKLQHGIPYVEINDLHVL